MARNRLGDALIAYMTREDFFRACVMDGCMGDVWFDVDPPPKLWKGMNPHPMNRAQVVASYIARDDRFESRLIKAHDTLGRERNLRLFLLKPEFLPVGVSA